MGRGQGVEDDAKDRLIEGARRQVDLDLPLLPRRREEGQNRTTTSGIRGMSV